MLESLIFNLEMHILNSIGKIFFPLLDLANKTKKCDFSILSFFDIMQLLETSFFNRMFHENGSQARFRKTVNCKPEKRSCIDFLQPFPWNHPYLKNHTQTMPNFFPSNYGPSSKIRIISLKRDNRLAESNCTRTFFI